MQRRGSVSPPSPDGHDETPLACRRGRSQLVTRAPGERQAQLAAVGVAGEHQVGPSAVIASSTRRYGACVTPSDEVGAAGRPAGHVGRSGRGRCAGRRRRRARARCPHLERGRGRCPGRASRPRGTRAQVLGRQPDAHDPSTAAVREQVAGRVLRPRRVVVVGAEHERRRAGRAAARTRRARRARRRVREVVAGADDEVRLERGEPAHPVGLRRWPRDEVQVGDVQHAQRRLRPRAAPAA